MSNFSDSSAAEGADFEESLQTSLQAGLSALKQKNYAAAIVHLVTVHETATNVPTLLKAQMGLVKAYYSTGETDQAVALCKPLCTHTNPQVKAWASQTLRDLEQRSAEAFLQKPTHQTGTNFANADATGFVPLTKTDFASPATSPDQTGFVPLSTPPNKTRERIAPENTTPNDITPTNISPDKTSQAISQDLSNPEETELLPLEIPKKPQAAIEPFLKSPVPVSNQIAKQKTQAASTRSPSSQIAHIPLSDSNQQLIWRQAGRAQKWTNLRKTDISPLWALQILTLLLLGWILDLLVQIGQTCINGLIFFFAWIPFLRPIWIADADTWSIAIGLLLLFAASPWLLHWLLQQIYQSQSFSLSDLDHYSPEAVRLLKRVSHQRRHPVPKLMLLPIAAPLVFSYGHLPRLTHIAVSQGLLTQLSDDEIAAIYAAELAHIGHWDFAVLSGLALVLQLPYRLYWSVATWGHRQHDRVLQSVAVLVSSIGYGIYWCCRFAGIWLSRVRLYYSDRTATNLTGNPNGLTRALLKITLGTAAAIQQQGYTGPLLESFDLLTPVGHQSALTLGSIYPHNPDPALLTWDRSHRFRRWLTFGSSHILLGDRLSVLNTYAQHWRLESELDWTEPVEKAGQNSQIPSLKSRRLLLQTAPLVGILVGMAIGLSFWLLGWITAQMHSYSFDWLWYDRDAIAQGCMLLGFGIGLMIQINPAFRDITRSTLQVDPVLAELMSNTTAMPIDSTPVRLQGKLLGRRSFHNRLYQDLLLQTSSGLIRLHYISRGGFLGNLCSQSQRPTDWIKPNTTVTVTGWFRRGATPWIDIDTIQTQRGITIRSGQPIWFTIVAVTSALWGVYTIFKG